MGMTGKNFENNAGAIAHFDIQKFLQITHLSWRKIVIKYDFADILGF
ncbi:MAG: hypothetical protein BWX60_01049 [Candidatus Marinimicrobia bacterium ADurb.Bin030]|nr:MAG: hypothetical protein BWX60_01049 [Candidatus Marinimicrobia bacterium ADurb.Bin030]